jgi:hypothetical protein
MDYQEALVALEESVARSPQEPANAPRGTNPLEEVNSKQRRPRDDADMSLPRLPPPADPQENAGASAPESLTLPAPNLTLARTQYGATQSKPGKRNPLT